MFPKVKILNLEILSISKHELLSNLEQGVLFTPNVDHLIKLQKNKEFYKVYKEAEWVICDSTILHLTSRLLGSKIKEVISGSDFFPEYCNFHKNNEAVKIFLLGAAPGIAEIAKQKINNRIGRNIIVGAHSPSFGFDKNIRECSEIVDMINQTDATVLMVGVGAPKQEKWIIEHKRSLNRIRLFMGLGATIDFEAGNKKRAPKIFKKLCLEWFYRMMKEPNRLIKRYILDDLPYFYFIFKQKIGKYSNPFEEF